MFFGGMPGVLRPPRTPFGEPGRPSEPAAFYYFTNRMSGRFSYLLTDPLAREKLDYLYFHPQHGPGYNQLWVFEKRYASARPTDAQCDERPFRRHEHYPEGLARNDWPGRLLVLLREPDPRSPVSNDVLRYYLRENAAIKAADAYTRRQGRRAVVGLMLADLNWH